MPSAIPGGRLRGVEVPAILAPRVAAPVFAQRQIPQPTKAPGRLRGPFPYPCPGSADGRERKGLRDLSSFAYVGQVRCVYGVVGIELRKGGME